MRVKVYPNGPEQHPLEFTGIDYVEYIGCGNRTTGISGKGAFKRVLRVNEGTTLAILLENEEPDGE